MISPGLHVRPPNVTVRNLAFKEIATTGTISGGSNQLTVASATGFTVNDSVIIAVGGEAGAGLRGSKGVGGTWPALSYATTVAMNADSGQAANTYAWVLATGDVYQFVTGTWTQVAVTDYYTAKAVPKALVATISQINGSVLTLSTTATVAATNANVYFDNLAIFNAARALNSDTEVTLLMGAGTFAISERLLLQRNHHFVLQGRGVNSTVIFSPDGVFNSNPDSYPGGLWAYQSDAVVFQDFHYRGNARLNGFGLFVTETDASSETYPYAINFVSSVGGLVRNVKTTDVFWSVRVSFGTDVWARSCQNFNTGPRARYIQWNYEWADCTNGGCCDCAADSDFAISGFEAFKGRGVRFTRSIGRNALFSLNSTGDFLVEDTVLSFDANCLYSSGGVTPITKDNPIVNVDTNTGGGNPDLGGTINRTTMTQAGYVNATNDSLRGIVINASNPNVTVDGGTYTAPNYASPGTYGPWGYDAPVATNPVLRNFTVVGTAKPDTPNISIGPTGTITNCTAGVITGP